MNKYIFISLQVLIIASVFINTRFGIVPKGEWLLILLGVEILISYFRRAYIGLKGNPTPLLFSKKYFKELKLMYTAP